MTASSFRIIELDSDNIILKVTTIEHATVDTSYDYTVASSDAAYIKLRSCSGTDVYNFILTKI